METKGEDVDEEGNTNETINIDELVDAGDEEEDAERMAMEESPKGRFKRFAQELGSGAYKTVYKAIDQDTGREVAWNVIKLRRLPKGEKKRIMEEINLIKNLKHDNIIHFISAWVVRQRDEVVFITEMVTGGSLHQYLKRIKHPRLKVLKTWAREILKGLQYLHEQETPIIHRDIKCDNVFINSNSGEIRIGDLGLSTTMKASHAKSVLGTPEFMAPELYQEHYGQGVDIYAFGMCMLEMVTLEPPYKECQNAAQVYKKVSDGIKPQALQRIKNPKVVSFIESCICPPKHRPTARELLESEFLMNLESEDNNEMVGLLPPIHAASTSSVPQKHSHHHETPVHRRSSFAAAKFGHEAHKAQQLPPQIPPKIPYHQAAATPVHSNHVHREQAVHTPGAHGLHAPTHQGRPDLHVNTAKKGYASQPQSAKIRGGGPLYQKHVTHGNQEMNLLDLSPEPRAGGGRLDDSAKYSMHRHPTMPYAGAVGWKRKESSSSGGAETGEWEENGRGQQEKTEERREADGAAEADEQDNTDTDEDDPALMAQAKGKVDILVHYENAEGKKEIAFEFDLERDSAVGVVEEMHEELQLSHSDKQAIVQQIRDQVKKKIKEEQMKFENQKEELFRKMEEVEHIVSEITGILNSMDHARLQAWFRTDVSRVRSLQELLTWKKKLE